MQRDEAEGVPVDMRPERELDRFLDDLPHLLDGQPLQEDDGGLRRLADPRRPRPVPHEDELGDHRLRTVAATEKTPSVECRSE